MLTFTKVELLGKAWTQNSFDFTKVEQERLEHKTRSTLLKSNRTAKALTQNSFDFTKAEQDSKGLNTKLVRLYQSRTGTAWTQNSFDLTKVEQERLEHNFINFIKVRVRKCHFGAIVYMFFLNWKINYDLFQFLENMLLPLQVASLAEIRSSSIIAESWSKTSLDNQIMQYRCTSFYSIKIVSYFDLINQ